MIETNNCVLRAAKLYDSSARLSDVAYLHLKPEARTPEMAKKLVSRMLSITNPSNLGHINGKFYICNGFMYTIEALIDREDY